MNFGGVGDAVGGFGDKVEDIQEKTEDVPGADQVEDVQEGLEDNPIGDPSDAMDKVDSVKEQMSDGELQEAFNCIDKDGSGLVDKSELEKGCHLLGIDLTSEELEEVMADADKDGDGLDFEEFKRVVNNKGRETVDCQKSKLEKAFNALDEDGSGSLDANEFKNYMVECGDGMSKEDAEDLINQIKPGGEEINLQDFLSFFSKNLRMPGSSE